MHKSFRLAASDEAGIIVLNADAVRRFVQAFEEIEARLTRKQRLDSVREAASGLAAEIEDFKRHYLPREGYLSAQRYFSLTYPEGGMARVLESLDHHLDLLADNLPRGQPDLLDCHRIIAHYEGEAPRYGHAMALMVAGESRWQHLQRSGEAFCEALEAMSEGPRRPRAASPGAPDVLAAELREALAQAEEPGRGIDPDNWAASDQGHVALGDLARELTQVIDAIALARRHTADHIPGEPAP